MRDVIVIEVRASNLAARIDRCSGSNCRFGFIDIGEGSLVPQKAVDMVATIGVITHDLASRINGKGSGPRCTWNIDVCEDTLIPQKTVRWVDVAIVKVTHDLSILIYIHRIGVRRTRNIKESRSALPPDA